MAIQIDNAIDEFVGTGSKWNETLAHWVYGETYTLFGRKNLARSEFEQAIEKFDDLAIDYHRQHQYEKHDECYEFKKRIEIKIKAELDIFSDLDEDGDLDQTIDTFDEIGIHSTEPPLAGIVSAPYNPQQSTKVRTHIIIPVDIDAMENPYLPSRILESPYTKLEIYNRTVNQNYDPDTISSQPISIAPSSLRISSFPVYGEATAGSEGGRLELQQIDVAREVRENLQIQFSEQDYQVLFMNQTDPRPTVLQNRPCGWIKVTGNSMNTAPSYAPNAISINDQDYALFDQTYRTIDTCMNQVVVVSVLENRELPSQPMIKRLKMNERSLILESSSDESIYTDIIISQNDEDDLVLHGLVIVIAKPISPLQ